MARALGSDAGGLVDSLLLITARIGANLLALAWIFMMARLLVPDEAGRVFQAMALAQLGSALVTANLESGSMRFLVTAEAAGRADVMRGFIRLNRLLVGALLVPVAALVAVLLWRKNGGAADFLPLALSAVAAVPMIALARMTSRHAAALGAIRPGLLPRLLAGPLVLTIGLVALHLGGAKPAAWHIVALFTLSEIIAAALQQYLLRRRFAFMAQGPADMSGWRDWARQGAWLAPGLAMSEYRKSLLIALAALVLAPGDVSRLAIAFSIINFISFGVVAVDVAFMPRIARAMASGDAVRRDHLLALSMVIKLAGLALGAALVWALGPLVLALLGPEYVSAEGAMMIMLLIPVLSVLAGPGAGILMAAGLGRLDFASNLAGGVTLALAMWLGGRLGGVDGAAWGAVAGLGVTVLLAALLSRRGAGIGTTIACLRHLRQQGEAAK
ncbi:MAG: hypothetical protein Q4F71_05395 [Paracoccus sp. (in: a-proteobacteria)]|nr:hypothetical protein [Paracoccus sp. (in: a-proteobacteria)]